MGRVNPVMRHRDYQFEPERAVLKIRVSTEALREIAAAMKCSVVIPEPDEDGFTEPVFTREPTPIEPSHLGDVLEG